MPTIWSGSSKTPEKDFLWELTPYQAFQTLTFRHFRKVHCSILFSKWDPKGQKTEAKIAYRLSGSSNIICTRFWHSSTLPPTIAEAGGKYCTHHTNKNFCKSENLTSLTRILYGVSAVWKWFRHLSMIEGNSKTTRKGCIYRAQDHGWVAQKLMNSNQRKWQMWNQPLRWQLMIVKWPVTWL